MSIPSCPPPSSSSFAYLQGPRLQLRAMEPSDVDVIHAMENDPEAWDVTNLTSPYSRYAIMQYITSSQNDLYADRQVRLMITLRTNLNAHESLKCSNVERKSHAVEDLGKNLVAGSETQSGTAIGAIDLTNFSPQHARAELGMVVLRAYRGRGYAREAVAIACRYAFGPLHLHQVLAHAAVGNTASIAVLRACGFRECGRIRQWWRTPDGYQDVLLMQLLQSDQERPFDCTV